MRPSSKGSGTRTRTNKSRKQQGFDYTRDGRRHSWSWLVLSCILVTLTVCIFSWIATFGLLPERALAGGESVLAADYSPWQGYRTLNLDIVRLATAAAQGDSPWLDDIKATFLPPSTAAQITSQASPLPTLTSTEFAPTQRPTLPRVTGTLPPTISANTITPSLTVTFTEPPPPPTHTLPPPTNTLPPPATETFTPTPSETPTVTLTPTATQIPPPPGVELSEPPDNNVYAFCNSSVIIDLYTHPITVPGSSLRFYEHWNALASPPPEGVMYLDFIQIEVCSDVGCSAPYQIFRWGDGNSGNNGNLPASYGATEDAAETFYGSKVGINITISGVPDGTYQFLRLSTPGSDCGTDPDHNAQIDALIVSP